MNEAVVENYKRENPKRDVAVVGLRNETGQVLLVRTQKLPDSWQPVGGGIDPEDESEESAAIREVREEIGVKLNPSSLRLILTVPYDFGEGSVYFFEAIMPSEISLDIDTAEILEFKWFDVSESLLLPAFPATKEYLKSIAGENISTI